jgi:hypothetical protein
MTATTMTATTMTATTTPAPVPGRRLLAALGIGIGVASAVAVATFLAAQAIVPQWATAANLSAVIAAESYTALVLVLLLVIKQALGWRTPHREDVVWGLVATAATWAAVAAVYLALWPLLGSLDGLFDVLAFVGSDGGRLAVVGPRSWCSEARCMGGCGAGGRPGRPSPPPRRPSPASTASWW